MKKTAKYFEKYKEGMYYYTMEMLSGFEDEAGPFDRLTGMYFMNKVVSFALKIGFINIMADEYRQYKNDARLLEITVDIMNEYATKLPAGYNPEDKAPPLWSNDSVFDKKKQDLVKEEINEFFDFLESDFAREGLEYLEKLEFNEQNAKLVRATDDLLQQILTNYIVGRAAKSDKVEKKDLEKFIRENIFWKGRGAEIVADIKMYADSAL